MEDKIVTEPASRTNTESYYPLRLDDPSAVYLGSEDFPAVGDGAADDAPAIQAAIDHVHRTSRYGIVLVPSGTYRLGGTVYIYRGIRLIGYGPTRPVFLLGPSTPGYDGEQPKYMVHFANYPASDDGKPLADASNITFFSGMSNIDIEIADGNPSAIAVRYNVAQHCSIEHSEFRLGTALAGVEQAGNEIEDVRFIGGKYGLRTGRTSAGWQFLLLDCEFEGQSVAAVETHEAGLTCIRTSFRNSPAGIVVPEGKIEQLLVQDCEFDDVGVAIAMDGFGDPTNHVNLRNIACRDVGEFLRFRNADAAPDWSSPEGASYVVNEASFGLHVEPKSGQVSRQVVARLDWSPAKRLPPLPPRDYPSLPPRDEWVNVRSLHLAGDGKTDDTAALQKAVNDHRTLYLPMGDYRVSDTITLRPDSVLIGLHPATTSIVVHSREEGFTDADAPKAVLVAPQGGRCVVTGIGVNPGLNAGAVAVKWLAGERSYMDDFYFNRPRHNFDWANLPPEERPKRPPSRRKGKDGFASLWIADGGAGVFKNIWSECYFARSGMLITDTSSRGVTYLLSIEHHLDVEVEMRNVANWTFHALQTEENRGSENATAVKMTACGDLEFTNLFMYRVMASEHGHPQGVWMDSCRNIVFRGFHAFSLGPYPFDNGLYLADEDMFVPDREASHLVIGD